MGLNAGMASVLTSHCNTCLGDTRHRLLRRFKSKWDQGDDIVEPYLNGTTTYEMLKCEGCDTVSLRRLSYCEQSGDTEVSYFPPTVQRQEPKWINHLSDRKGSNRRRLLRQVYIALNNNCPLLAVMGIRALIENVMIDKVHDQGSFADNLTEFENRGYVTHRQRAQLNSVLELGHATIHRSFSPNADAVEFALDFTENLLQSIYVHAAKAKGIRVPKRKRKTVTQSPAVTPSP